jgi:hypothetical protein
VQCALGLTCLRFLYVRNDPVNYVDPDGRDPWAINPVTGVFEDQGITISVQSEPALPPEWQGPIQQSPNVISFNDSSVPFSHNPTQITDEVVAMWWAATGMMGLGNPGTAPPPSQPPNVAQHPQPLPFAPITEKPKSKPPAAVSWIIPNLGVAGVGLAGSAAYNPSTGTLCLGMGLACRQARMSPLDLYHGVR